MNELKNTTQELKKRFAAYFDSIMEEVDNNRVHGISHRIDRMHARLNELQGEVNKAMNRQFKKDSEDMEKDFGL